MHRMMTMTLVTLTLALGLAGCAADDLDEPLPIDQEEQVGPTDGDNSSTSTTSSGSAATYPMNRVWNPDNSLLGTACITTLGYLGTMESKCAAYPTTCGYLYCIKD
jgi:hypothetical protein